MSVGGGGVYGMTYGEHNCPPCPSKANQSCAVYKMLKMGETIHMQHERLKLNLGSNLQ